jgi:hypothetical protein
MKTAVEWFQEQIIKIVNGKCELSEIEIYNIAKEMEKEQIIEAHGNKLKKSRDTGNYEYWFSGEDYYNKTFKTN